MNAFNIAFMLQYLFQSFFVTAEKPMLGFMATVAAGVTNMVLDALFIAVLDWGVAGAAWASVIGQCVGGILPLIYFLPPNTSLLQLGKTNLELSALLKACLNGSSELMTNISTSIAGMLYNFQLLKYAGENGIAAYGVVMYTQMLFWARTLAVLILPVLFGLDGIWWAITVAEAFALVISVAFILAKRKKYHYL